MGRSVINVIKFGYNALLVVVLVSQLAQAQSVSFEVTNQIEIRDSNGNVLSLANTGGLNQPQFYSLDINNDGIDDLFVFDRNGNKVVSLIHDGNSGYSYQPKYDHIYPVSFNDWVVFKAYNNDGLADMWFNNAGVSGVGLYKNVSQSGDPFAQFEQVSNELRAYNFNTPPLDTNSVYADIINIPAIEDVDGDGDIDFISIQNPGFGASLFLNTSMETSGNLEDITFDIADACWGSFSESTVDNRVKFERNQFCRDKHYRYLKKKHEGGTSLLLFDNDGDGDMDVLMGNAGLRNLNYLENGKVDFALKLDSMIASDSMFPRNSVRAEVNTFPASYYVDVTGDGVNDLIVSVNYFDKTQNFFRETGNVLFYENTGKNNKPVFEFKDSSFLVDQMVDHGGYTAPLLWDMDNDDDLDLIIATNGDWALSHDSSDYLILYENIGDKTNPIFQLTKVDYLGLKSEGIQHMVPTLGNIDSDGTIELLVGQQDGSINQYDILGSGKTATASFVANYILNSGVASNSTPFITDVDGDGNPDLLVGSDNGRTQYYEITSTDNVVKFNLVKDTFGGVTTGEFRTIQWYDPDKDIFFDTLIFEAIAGVHPALVDLDKNGDPEFITGDLNGQITVYTDVRNAQFKQLNRAHDVFYVKDQNQCYTYSFGANAKPAFGDLNNDGFVDMVIGNDRGGIQFALGGNSCNLGLDKLTKNQMLHIYPNPTNGILHMDADHLANAVFTVINLNGVVVYQQNVGMENEIDLSFLRSGVYIVKRTTQNESRLAKLIKVD